MPLEDYYPWTVVFIVVPSATNEGTEYNVPIGTGFLVGRHAEATPGIIHLYAVTASHVVSNGAPTMIRLKKSETEFMDVAVPEWIHHSTADVAVAPLRLPGSVIKGERPITVSIDTDKFVGDWRVLGDGQGWEPDLGERVYFIGLFDRFGSMGERNIPMTRSGTIGALNVPHVPIGLPENRRYVEAHLIDCRSYNGFSGSPCFVQRDMSGRSSFREGGAYVDDESGRIDTETALLGVISGHFDMWDAVRFTGDLAMEPGTIEAPLNTGVGVVTPAKFIKELLDMDELADDRKQTEERLLKAKKDRDEGATLDTAGDESEFERFKDLTRKLVNTPKPEKGEPSE
jgi:hypothetical protein